MERRIAALLLKWLAVLSGLPLPAAAHAQGYQQKPEIWLVNLTASWCPNCRVLDPRLSEAVKEFPGGSVVRTTLDFTSDASTTASFARVRGTPAAGVYDDHLGVTGLAVILSADTGEKLACIDRSLSVEEISARLSAARAQVRREAPLNRRLDGRRCPTPNAQVQPRQTRSR